MRVSARKGVHGWCFCYILVVYVLFQLHKKMWNLPLNPLKVFNVPFEITWLSGGYSNGTKNLPLSKNGNNLFYFLYCK